MLLKHDAIPSRWGLERIVFVGHSLASAHALILHSDVIEAAAEIERFPTDHSADRKMLSALSFTMSEKMWPSIASGAVVVESTAFALPPLWGEPVESASGGGASQAPARPSEEEKSIDPKAFPFTRANNPVNAKNCEAFVHSSDLVPPLSKLYDYTYRVLEWSKKHYEHSLSLEKQKTQMDYDNDKARRKKGDTWAKLTEREQKEKWKGTPAEAEKNLPTREFVMFIELFIDLTDPESDQAVASATNGGHWLLDEMRNWGNGRDMGETFLSKLTEDWGSANVVEATAKSDAHAKRNLAASWLGRLIHASEQLKQKKQKKDEMLRKEQRVKLRRQKNGRGQILDANLFVERVNRCQKYLRESLNLNHGHVRAYLMEEFGHTLFRKPEGEIPMMAGRGPTAFSSFSHDHLSQGERSKATRDVLPQREFAAATNGEIVATLKSWYDDKFARERRAVVPEPSNEDIQKLRKALEIGKNDVGKVLMQLHRAFGCAESDQTEAWYVLHVEVAGSGATRTDAKPQEIEMTTCPLEPCE